MNQKTHFEQEGWALFENVVAKADLDAVVDLICDFWQVQPDGSQTPRKGREVVNGIVPIHQHQALWNTRQSPALHQAFATVHGTEALWVTVDRASYKPKISSRANTEPGHANAIHLDHDPADGQFRVQGVLYLTDTLIDQGAWECVPALFKAIKAGRTDFERGQDVAEEDILRVPGKAGSLVIWDSRMPHSSSHNWTDTPRFAQYIAMNPEGETDRQEDRASRIDNWRSRRAPVYWRNMPGQLDPEPWEAPAVLTPLGEKLLGLHPW